MSDNHPDTGYSAIAQVEAYWEALRGTRLMPKRSEIDPRGIEHALEFAFILERIAPGVARLRIAGSHLNDLMGMETRGMPVTAFFRTECRRRIADTLEDVFQTPATCQMRLSTLAGAGHPPLDARLVMLPLKSDLGDVSRVLGCLVSRGETRPDQCRFTIDKLDLHPIVPGQPLATDRQADGAALLTPVSGQMDMPTTPERAPGFAAPRTAFDGRPEKRRPPYLRLVKSDDS